ncbi:hypothetical protein E4U61_003381 [Claviceps capensis]|nr:hypothetical protein E4U61_003381 [Claviceps capensis]
MHATRRKKRAALLCLKKRSRRSRLLRLKRRGSLGKVPVYRRKRAPGLLPVKWRRMRERGQRTARDRRRRRSRRKIWKQLVQRRKRTMMALWRRWRQLWQQITPDPNISTADLSPSRRCRTRATHKTSGLENVLTTVERLLPVAAVVGHTILAGQTGFGSGRRDGATMQ